MLKSLHAKQAEDLRNFWMKTHEYSSHGCRYCRFVWGCGRTINGYAHISGGAADTPLVQRRREWIDRAISRGAPLNEILAILRDFPNERPGRKRF